MQLLIWCSAYYVLGYVSLFLIDPLSRVSFVWFPAGLAVSAFLLTSRHRWPWLFIALFTTRTLLDVTLRHSPETALVHSAISLSNDMAIALCVRHFARAHDPLHNLVVWLFATLITSGVAATLGGGWIMLRHDVNLVQTVWIWWSANVVGTILLTTIVMGLCRQQQSGTRHWFRKVALWLLLCLSAYYVFHQPIGGPRGEAFLFSLACIPVVLVIMIPIISGNQIGALSFLSFCIIVIYYSWQRNGPLFIPGLRPGEPLFLAQCYLTGIALMLNFVFMLHYRKHPVPVTSYYMEPKSGRLTWDSSTSGSLPGQLSYLHHAEQLLALMSPDDQHIMRQRWASVQSGQPVNSVFSFLLTLPAAKKIMLRETKLIALQRAEGVVLIGYLTGDVYDNHAVRIIAEE